MPGTGSERRQHPRVSAGAGLRLHAGEAECHVLDISCAGVRFVTPSPPPLMSLVDVRLEIPSHDGDATVLACQGAVVRTDAYADESGEQEVAIFFTRLEDADRLLIRDYVRRNSEPAASA